MPATPLRGDRALALPILALLAVLAACTETPTSQSGVDAPPPILASLEAGGYTGPVLVAERSPSDRRGRGRTSTVVYLPGRRAPAAAVPAGTSLVEAGPAGDRVQAQEVTDPDLMDPDHNTPTDDLSAFVFPALENAGANNVVSTISQNIAFWAYDYDEGRWYRVSDASVLETRLDARDSAAGHYHGPEGSGTAARRVGRIEPEAGSFATSWSNTWYAPIFAQEVSDRYRVAYTTPSGFDEEDWFYGSEPLVSRNPFLVRVPPNPQYVRVGTTPVHPSPFNHWGDADMVARIPGFTAQYAVASGGDHTRVNDISLFYGGKFDLGGAFNTGQTSHEEHRYGTEMDARPADTSPIQRARFVRALERAGYASYPWEGNHYHIRTAGSPYNQ